MACIPTISPWLPASQVSPTILVLAISIIREAFEDCHRHSLDTRVNSEVVQRIKAGDGTLEKIKSKDIKVGDILVIRDEQDFPSDMILIDSSIKGDSQWTNTSFAEIDCKNSNGT
jgi:P-type E1-E2 ATPase